MVVSLTYGFLRCVPVPFLKSFGAAWETNNQHEASTWNSEEVSGSTRQNNTLYFGSAHFFHSFQNKACFGHAVYLIKRPFDAIFSPIMLSSLISNFERITYCLGTWKNSSVIWLGWSVEKVKCACEKEWLIFSSAVLMAVCQSWQRKWKWPQVSGFLPCCSHINDGSHCIISPPPLSLSFALFRFRFALSISCLSYYLWLFHFLWKNGRFDGFMNQEIWTFRMRRKSAAPESTTKVTPVIYPQLIHTCQAIVGPSCLYINISTISSWIA